MFLFVAFQTVLSKPVSTSGTQFSRSFTTAYSFLHESPIFFSEIVHYTYKNNFCPLKHSCGPTILLGDQFLTHTFTPPRNTRYSACLTEWKLTTPQTWNKHIYNDVLMLAHGRERISCCQVLVGVGVVWSPTKPSPRLL